MAYCGPRGIPHSYFLGGPAVWSADDREKALAWVELERVTCPSCGTRPDEWDEKQGGHRHAYSAEVRFCPGCSVLERAEVERQETAKVQRGVKVVMRPRGPA